MLLTEQCLNSDIRAACGQPILISKGLSSTEAKDSGILEPNPVKLNNRSALPATSAQAQASGILDKSDS